jgi:phosphopantetheinyl transferase (holo-ACP synthase)
VKLDFNQQALLEKTFGFPIEVVLRPDWGAEHKNHRQDIHKNLSERGFHPLQSELTFLHPHFSIAHCGKLGGYASMPPLQEGKIGFDVEEVPRISEKVARRICTTDKEYQQAPSPSLLWVAKEASYKSLRGPRQPETITAVEIHNWSLLDRQTATFGCSVLGKNESSHFIGLSMQIADLAYGFVHFVPG